jgi:DNA-binding CsgD family transcriptional regulator
MTDPIGILESAYSLDGDERRWAALLAEAVRQNVQDNLGVVVQTYDATRSDLVCIRATAHCGVDARMVEAMQSRVALRESEHSALVPILRASFVGSLRSAPAALGRSGLPEERVCEFNRNLDQFFRFWHHADHLWVNAQDPTGIGCVIIVPLRKRRALSPRVLHGWRCIAAHVAAAFRVRRQLESPRGGHADAVESAEAILAPNGLLKHAGSAARQPSARGILLSAVRAQDRSRGPLRRTDPERAIATWKALVAGRWSLVDHFDSDGRRFILAHRNDADVPDARGLTLRERQVLAHAALGHSNKVIAYELGLSTSTVAFHLARARAKLRLRSAAGLFGSEANRSHE